MSADAGRFASRMCEGVRPDRPAPEVERGRSEGPCEPDPPRPSVLPEPQCNARRSADTTSSVGPTGMSCSREAQARRRGPSWIRVATRETTESGRTSEIGLFALLARLHRHQCPQVGSDSTDRIHATSCLILMAKSVAPTAAGRGRKDKSRGSAERSRT